MLKYALLLGAFDGLHLGHGALLAAAKETGLPIRITSMYGGKGGELFSRAEREILYARAGIAESVSFTLDEKTRSLPAEAFADAVLKEDVGHLFCGEDFRFGKDALGTPELLGRRAHCPVTVLPLVTKDGEKISVSACKRLLAARSFSELGALLLFPYFIGGRVEHGRQTGRTYGFPTLNVRVPEEKLLPPDGVYAGWTDTPFGRYRSIVNIGTCPTFGVEERKIEAHLLDFGGDLYGSYVEIVPSAFLRPVVRFDSAEALAGQLRKDENTARGIIR